LGASAESQQVSFQSNQAGAAVLGRGLTAKRRAKSTIHHQNAVEPPRWAFN